MIRSLSARLARLEVQSAAGKDSRQLTDAQLDAEIARLSARLGIADLSPAERVLFLNEVLADGHHPPPH